jgi:hypothetical protein
VTTEMLVERRAFVMGVVLVFASAISGAYLNALWQPYGPYTLIDWGRIVGLIGGVVLVVAAGAGAAARKRRDSGRPAPP